MKHEEPVLPAFVDDVEITQDQLDAIVDRAVELAESAGISVEAAVDQLIVTDFPQMGTPLVHDMRSAEGVGRILARTEADVEQIGRDAAYWMAQITEWRDRQIKPLLARHHLLVPHLKQFALDRRAADPKNAKTLSLPSVTVSTRGKEGAVKVVIVDDKAVLAWALGLNEDVQDTVIKTTQEVQISTLRKVTKIDRHEDDETGEVAYVVIGPQSTIVEGVSVVADPITATVTVER